MARPPVSQLQSSAAIFKVDSAFGFKQWFYERLEPWVHYIPVAADLSDLRRRFDWAEAHPAEVQLMVSRANEAMAAITYETEVQVGSTTRLFVCFSTDRVSGAPHHHYWST